MAKLSRVLEAAVVIIPPESLSADTLNSILEEFISREGTDYGEIELSLEQKLALLRPQVMRREVLIVYDDKQQSVHLVPKNNWAGEPE